MRILLLLLIIGLFGCNKPNPNPELTDPIYQDLQSQAQTAKKDAEAEKKKLAELKKEVLAVTPQSGMLKRIQKRYFDSELSIKKFEQLNNYYELKAESRLKYTRVEYMKSFKAGKPWPTKEEIAAYKQYKDSVKVENSWSTRKRVEKYEKANGISSAKPETQKKPEKKAESEEKAE